MALFFLIDINYFILFVILSNPKKSKMKKIYLFCLTIVTLTFSACSNDDDNNNNRQNQFANFLKIDDIEYELKTGTIEDYGEYQPGIYNFDIVLLPQL